MDSCHSSKMAADLLQTPAAAAPLRPPAAAAPLPARRLRIARPRTTVCIQRLRRLVQADARGDPTHLVQLCLQVARRARGGTCCCCGVRHWAGCCCWSGLHSTSPQLPSDASVCRHSEGRSSGTSSASAARWAREGPAKRGGAAGRQSAGWGGQHPHRAQRSPKG